jgi:hypothetical protein
VSCWSSQSNTPPFSGTAVARLSIVMVMGIAA